LNIFSMRRNKFSASLMCSSNAILLVSPTKRQRLHDTGVYVCMCMRKRDRFSHRKIALRHIPHTRELDALVLNILIHTHTHTHTHTHASTPLCPHTITRREALTEAEARLEALQADIEDKDQKTEELKKSTAPQPHTRNTRIRPE
jgi:hypothetical protein